MSGSSVMRSTLIIRLFPLRASRRADVLARRQHRASSMGYGFDRAASSAAAVVNRDPEEDVGIGSSRDARLPMRTQVEQPVTSGFKGAKATTGSSITPPTYGGRRTGYGRVQTTSSAASGQKEPNTGTSNTSSRPPSARRSRSAYHLPEHIPPTPNPNFISNPKASRSSTLNPTDTLRTTQTTTLRKREEDDFKQAVRMETKRMMEKIGGGGNRIGPGVGVVVEGNELAVDGSRDSVTVSGRTPTPRPTLSTKPPNPLHSHSETPILHPQSPLHHDHCDHLDHLPDTHEHQSHEPESHGPTVNPDADVDFYMDWKVTEVEKGLIRGIRKGGRIGQKMILPTLLDKASKLKLARHEAATAAQTSDHPEFAPVHAKQGVDPAAEVKTETSDPVAGPLVPMLSADDEVIFAMDTSTFTGQQPRPDRKLNDHAGAEMDLKLKLSRKGEAEIRGVIREEVEELRAAWERAGQEIAQATFLEERLHRRESTPVTAKRRIKTAPAKKNSATELQWQAQPPLPDEDLLGIRDADSPDALLPDVDPPLADCRDEHGIRRNPVGVQLLSPSLHRQLFPGKPLPRPPKQIIDISLAHLADNGLSPTATSTAPEISFDMPPLLGDNIREHFHILGRESAEPYLSASLTFASSVLPARPKVWAVDGPGWRRYGTDGAVEIVEDLGGETMICFDVETMYLKSPYAVMATAVTPNAWYSWISPALFAQAGESGPDGKRLDHASTLIPLTRSDGKTPAVVIGHNVGYDRARVLDEYQMDLSNNRWLDTLSLHVATKGITSVQRPAWQQRKKEKTMAKEVLTESQILLRDIEGIAASGSEDFEPSGDSKEIRWEDVSGPNSLASVADLHCGIKISKDVRNRFGESNMDSATEFVPDLQLLLDYCASDVHTTHAVLSKVLPLFLQSCPHPASFAGALGMGNAFLPIDGAWAKYLEHAEAKYQENLGGVQAILAELAYKLKKRGPVKGDLWTEQLDWSEKTARWTAEEVEGPSETDMTAQREAEGQDLVHLLDQQAPDIPPATSATVLETVSLSAIETDEKAFAAWEPLSDDWQDELRKWTENPPHISKLGDILPYILQVTYLGYPLVSHPEHRWIIRVPSTETNDSRLASLDRLDIPSNSFVYLKPTKAKVLTPFGKIRGKEWRGGQYDSPYRGLTDKLIAGASRKSVAEAIESAAQAFCQTSQGLAWDALRRTRASQATEAAPVMSPKPVNPSKRPRKNNTEWWPRWFHDLTLPASRAPAGELDLTVRKRIAPLLLRMAWKGHPLAHSREHGWTYRVNSTDPDISSYSGLEFAHPADARLQADKDAVYCKVPHASGEAANVGNPLSKNFLQYIANGTLGSAKGTAGDDDGDIASAARHAMQMNAQCSYWTSARERIMGQMAVYAKDIDGIGLPDSAEGNLGMILPQVITMGTVTRRAVESTWLTASNAKKNRVGSELKAMVRAPPGYAIVGADVDSEELWIASVMGDAQFGMHGASAIGWMTLEGTKAAGTDLHSKTANILGTSRDYAKVFNYSRIYGAGVKHAMQLLLQNNAELPLKEAKKLADDLYAATKGKKSHRPVERGDRGSDVSQSSGSKHMWHGGSESYLFNTLEAVAYSGNPMTPGLGAGVTLALRQKFLPKDGVFGSDYLPSRINWVVQSSGVDYLHMLIVSMDHLIKRYDIAARYMISVHDEVRYMVKEEDKYRVALALQIANAWTRTLLSYNLGLDDLPQGVAFFSAVDVDRVFRKEVDMTCVTPSHLTPLPPGESLGIEKLLEITDGGRLGPVAGDALHTQVNSSTEVHSPAPTPLPDVFPAPNLRSHRHFAFLDAQASRDQVKVRRFLRS